MRNTIKRNATAEPAQELTAQQERAIELLAGGMSKTAAAAELGCGRETLWRWEQEPVYLAALAAARIDLHGAALDKVRALRGKALDVLAAMLEGDEPADRRFAVAQLLRYPLPDMELLGSTDPTDYKIEQQERASKQRRDSLFAHF